MHLSATSHYITDARLLELFAERRDQDAFAELVSRHGPLVLGVCRRTLSDPADAEDAFQATFLLLAMKAGKIREPHLLGNWLFGAAARIAANARRANLRRMRMEQRLMRRLQTPSSAGDAAIQQEIIGLLDEEIRRLASKYRTVVVLCYMEGKTRQQAAEELGWPQGTVATRLTEARNILRRRLSLKGIHASSSIVSLALMHAAGKAAVPPELVARTVKAAAVIIAGKAVAGAVSTKAIFMAKGASKAMFAAKLKLAAMVLAGLALTVGISAAVTQSPPAPKAQVKAEPPATVPPLGQSEMEISTNRALRIMLAIIFYANEHDDHYPPDLGATLPYCQAPENQKGRFYVQPADEKSMDIPALPSPAWINRHTSFVYLGDANLSGKDLNRLPRGQRNVVLLYQKPPLPRGHPISVGFSDGSAGWFSPPVARQYIDESLARIASLRSGPAAKPRVLEGFNSTAIPHFAEPSIPAETIQLPDAVRQALTANATALGPLLIQWNEHGDCPTGVEYAKSNYFVDEGFFSRWLYMTAWQSGKVYTFGRSIHGDVHEDSFDGSAISFTNYHPKPGLLKRAVDSTPIEKVLRRNPDAQWMRAEYFERFGLLLPVTARQLAVGQIRSKLLSMIDTDAHLAGVQESQLAGQAMTAVTLTADNPAHAMLHTLPKLRTYVFWLDPKMNDAVVRLEEKYAGQLVEVTRNDRFEKLAGRSVWIPRRVMIDLYTHYMIPDQFFDHPILSRVEEVTDIALDQIPTDRFVLSPQVPQEPASKDTLAAADAAGAQTAPEAVPPAVQLARGQSYSIRQLVLVSSLAGIAILAILGRLALAKK